MAPKVCHFWQQGKCTKGSRCRFAHTDGGSERSSGGFGGGQRNASRNYNNNSNNRKSQDVNIDMEVCRTQFTGFGPAGMANTVVGDVSAEELRWMLFAQPPNIWQPQLLQTRTQLDSALSAHQTPQQQQPHQQLQQQQNDMSNYFSSNNINNKNTTVKSGGAGGWGSGATSMNNSSYHNNNDNNNYSDANPVVAHNPFASPPSATPATIATMNNAPVSKPFASNAPSAQPQAVISTPPWRPQPTTTAAPPLRNNVPTIGPVGAAPSVSQDGVAGSQNAVHAVDIPSDFVFIQGKAGLSPQQEIEAFRSNEFTLNRIPENISLLALIAQ